MLSMGKACAIAHPKRKEYYIGIDEDDLSIYVNRYILITQMDYVTEKVKCTIYILGIIGLVEKIIG
ncbi:MAG: hypothetical protein ACYDEX_07965 [Mobilitalea sp.]